MKNEIVATKLDAELKNSFMGIDAKKSNLELLRSFFEGKVPNATIKRAMKEAPALIEARKVRFKNAGELLNDLEKGS